MGSTKNQSGYILLSTMILVVLAAVVLVSTLNVSSNLAHSVKATKTRSTEYYDSESSLGAAVSWLRQNSVSMVLAFSRTNFYTNFDKSSPSVGSNDSTAFKVPTKIKTRGTSKSIILSNDGSFLQGEFPTSLDAATGTAFDSKAKFSTANLGENKVRVTLVDAIAKDPTKDYGDVDTGSPAPDTDFYPVFRVDSLRSDQRGGQGYGYGTGRTAHNYGTG